MSRGRCFSLMRIKFSIFQPPFQFSSRIAIENFHSERIKRHLLRKHIIISVNSFRIKSFRRKKSNIRKFRNCGVVTFSSYNRKEQKRNRSKISILLDLAQQRREACIQNVPRATWIALWDVFNATKAASTSFAQTKILASTDFNFRTEWFHSKVNEQRVHIYIYINIFQIFSAKRIYHLRNMYTGCPKNIQTTFSLFASRLC